MGRRLFEPISIAPLVAFRVLGGLLITTEITGELFTRYRTDLTEPRFHFSYPFFEWIGPWPEPWLYLHYAMTIGAGLCVVAGLHYRFSAAVLWLGSTWLFLMDATLYINHVYLYSLVAGILIFLPAHRALSLDVRRAQETAVSCVAAWTRHILLFQIGVVYVFAGLAKLDADWLAGRPMRIWLAAKADYPLIGGLLDEPWLPLFLSRGGALFDLLIVPAMLWRRTRATAFTVVVLFHLANVSMFGIGTFPWFSLLMTTLFFPPEAFRRLPVLRSRLPACEPTDVIAPSPVRPRLVAATLALFALVQVGVPLRPWVYPRPTSWTEAGHMFSWRMMLRSKRGQLVYRVLDPATGRTWTEDPRTYLTPFQYRAMIGKPRMIVQFAHFLAETYDQRGVPGVRVTARCLVSAGTGEPET